MKTFKYYLPVIIFFIVMVVLFGGLIYLCVTNPGEPAIRYSADTLEIFKAFDSVEK